MILKKKLEEKGINFEVNDSVDKMLSIGIKEVPCLDTGESILNFKEAINWVNRQ